MDTVPDGKTFEKIKYPVLLREEKADHRISLQVPKFSGYVKGGDFNGLKHDKRG